ncbi:MAG: sulfurtransferase [Steroidobacteraceae bacterium]
MYRTLINARELHDQRGSKDLVIVDCRFDLAQSHAGESAFVAGHVPGAVYAHLDRDLSSPITPTSGRHPLPTPESLARLFSRWGIDASVQVVAYDQDSGAFAARLWWLLRWLGHEAAAVLDGGWAEWRRSGYEVSTTPATNSPRVFEPHVKPDLVVTTADVTTLVRDATARVLDARAPERYAGAVEPIDAVGGHVPGAHNLPFATTIDGDKHFQPPTELQQRFTSALGGVAPERSVAMCGSGVTACHLLLGMEHAGLHGAKLYAGSWSEWIRDSKRPVAKGASP